ncbi:ATP-binding cassette domain-containing protein [Paenibacillus pseudetheri]|uniref:Vitamin B12 import ATP-binding protein BtuD n=1 Tax=Paenibacillus pseudetheri TaxID=2897682 RepID=A0ABN8FHB1_9BACL|nr:ABC transporter ATP-binding protein [Paenibacillus pseudetheri]CAH1057418.1 Vitamin B12 import ATP-binding protein BtuD [Paenibacillus pseudetheri]
MTVDALLTLKEVSKKYGNRDVLTDVSLTINRGDCIILRGNNGSGKSTMLRIVSGLIPISSGERLLKHSNLVIGYTPDRLSKLRMTSTEYLTHMGRISDIPKKNLENRIRELHEFFSLEQSNTLKMTQFSKGMLQKTNLMQAMIKTPDILVLDEPFSGLDKESTAHLLNSLKKIKSHGTSILAAVHEPLLASQLENRTYWIRQGRILMDNSDNSSDQSTAFFELEGSVDQETLDRLSGLFSDVTWKTCDSGHLLFTIMQEDYRDFLLEFIHKGGVINNLTRKELKQ